MEGVRKRLTALVVVVAAAGAACTSSDPTSAPSSSEPPSSSGTAAVAPSHPGTQPSTDVPPTSPASKPPRTPNGTHPKPEGATFRLSAALRTIRFLATQVGPREASSAAYRRAAAWVQERFEANGYRVRRQRLAVPAGNSWGVDVRAGTTWNVVATAPGFDRTAPHLIVGAHLDTVPQAPGAEDNASGISVLLELSRLAATVGTRLPVMFVAFGAEEPRGDGDALHHFGSRAMVARMPAEERRAMTGMVSMDRVGVGTVVPVCAGGLRPPVLRSAVLRAANRAGVDAQACVNQSSDHWSFELAGMPSARVGGTSYAGYHSAGDVPAVVNPAQLRRVAALMWSWLARPAR